MGSLLAAEAEMNALNRRVQGLEEDLEKTEEKLVAANTKLDKAGTAADDSERAKKVFENKAIEEELKDARDKAEAADAAYEEVSKKLVQCDADLEKAEERADTGETKILELEEELRVVANNLKSLEVAEEKANQREKSYKEQIKTLTGKLRQEQSSLTSLYRSSRRKLIGLKMNLWLSRRSSKQLLRSWSKHLLKCLDIKKFVFFTLYLLTSRS